MRIGRTSLFLVPFIACTLTPVTAIAQSTDGEAQEIVVTGKYLDAWQHANAAEKRAAAALEAANRDVASAQAKVDSARSSRDDIRNRIDTERERFHSILNPIPDFKSADDAHDWTEKLEHAADKWEAAERHEDDGKSSLKKAEKALAKAQKNRASAEKTISKARKAMAEAVRKSRKDDVRAE